MKQFQFAIILSLFISLSLSAQQVDPVAITINGMPIYKSEVEQAYKKGHEQKEARDKTSFDQFVEGFINYKLNVAEAKEMKLDTMMSFKRDYASYRIMLASSYLKNPSIKENIIKMYHGRLQQNNELNHILLPFEKEAFFPADTLELYNKALDVRNNLLKTGFKGNGYIDNTKTTSMVMDKDARNGYLGWVMAFALQPQVEDAAYSLPVNEISMPIRSAKGYHIIQVLNRKPSAGLINIEQVTFGFREIPPRKHLIDSVGNVANKIYAKLLKEKNFDELCAAYLEVTGSDAKDCNFGIQALNADMPPSFLNAAFELKNIGDISQPVMTDYGYHIIRLKNKYPEPTLDEVKHTLGDNIMNSNRAIYYTQAWREWQSSEYNLKMDAKTTQMLYSIANTCNPLDSNFVKQLGDNNTVFFTIDSQRVYKLKDFEIYLRQLAPVAEDENIPIMGNSQPKANGLSTDVLKSILSDFTSRAISHYADSTLEQKHTQFSQIMKDYADGLLFFEIKNKEVWNKSSEDRKGLNEFFNKNKAKYKWQSPKFKGTIILSKDKASLEKAYKLIKANPKNTDFENIAKQINTDSTLIQIETGLWEEGVNKYADTKLKKKAAPAVDNNFPYYHIEGKILKSPEEVNDIRSEISMDYQNSLSTKWIEYLLKKYKVEENQYILKSIEQ